MLGISHQLFQLHAKRRLGLVSSRSPSRDPQAKLSLILEALRRAHGRPTRAARIAGLSYRMLHFYLVRFGLQPEPARLREQYRRRFRFGEEDA